MEAKELRIGNLVSDNYASDIFYAKVNKISETRVFYNTFHSHPKDLKPIPLNEQWLLNLGFNKDYKAGYIGIDVNDSDFVLTEPLIMGEWQKEYAFQFETGRTYKLKQIQYVHQLQNIYFALTGKELTIHASSTEHPASSIQ